MPSFRGSSWPRDWTCISYTEGGLSTPEPPGKPMWSVFWHRTVTLALTEGVPEGKGGAGAQCKEEQEHSGWRRKWTASTGWRRGKTNDDCISVPGSGARNSAHRSWKWLGSLLQSWTWTQHSSCCTEGGRGSLAQRFRLQGSLLFRNPRWVRRQWSPWHRPCLQGDLYKDPHAPQGSTEKAAMVAEVSLLWRLTAAPCHMAMVQEPGGAHTHTHLGLPTPSLLAHHHKSSRCQRQQSFLSESASETPWWLLVPSNPDNFWGNRSFRLSNNKIGLCICANYADDSNPER